MTKRVNLGYVVGPQGPQGKKTSLQIGTVDAATGDKEPNVYVEDFNEDNNEYTLGFTLPTESGSTSGLSSVIPVVPSQIGTVTYTGSEVSPKWNGYNPDTLDVANNVSTTVGTKTATFTPKEGFAWFDGTTSAKAASWSIVKANHPAIVMSPASSSSDPILLNESNNWEAVVTVQCAAKPTVVNNNSSMSAEVISFADGIATIKVKGITSTTSYFYMNFTVPASTNYNQTSFNIYVRPEGITATNIYGVEWDGTATSVWARTDDAARFPEPIPYKDGATTYRSPFDNIAPWSNMKRYEDPKAGSLVSIPKFYYKITQNGKGIKIQISNSAQTGFSVSPAHMNRGDGKGERDMIYVGRYHCSGMDYSSRTKTLPKNTITRSVARTGIAAVDTDVWQLDWATWTTLWLLYLVEFADWNSQSKIGSGNNNYPRNTGGTDDMPYHTGETSKDGSAEFQYRWIESPWGNVRDWLDGCYNASSGLYVILNPSKFSDTSNGTLFWNYPSPYTQSNNCVPNAWTVRTVSSLPTMIIPSDNSEKITTYSNYSCDCWYFYSSCPCLYVGGDYTYVGCGLFCCYCYSTGYAYSYIGCRLQKLP